MSHLLGSRDSHTRETRRKHDFVDIEMIDPIGRIPFDELQPELLDSLLQAYRSLRAGDFPLGWMKHQAGPYFVVERLVFGVWPRR
jgi:hypothetical protein